MLCATPVRDGDHLTPPILVLPALFGTCGITKGSVRRGYAA